MIFTEEIEKLDALLVLIDGALDNNVEPNNLTNKFWRQLDEIAEYFGIDKEELGEYMMMLPEERAHYVFD